ncbi:MAG TPA: Ku protein [Nitriliruptorales bacterium]|nr:Ku protein [Nitriliruptorales bacterium]
MARAIWSGAISFGLVNVPVKLYTAVQSRSVSFHQIARQDGARIRQKRVSSATGEEVPYEEIVKGYEIAPGRYVVIEPEELESLDPEASRTIDIQDFVDLHEIDPIHYDRPYYLGPSDQAAARPYRLLVEAMRETSKVGIATFVMRTKQYLAALRPKDGALLLSTMNYSDEIVPIGSVEGLPGEDLELRDRELQMAVQLVESLSTSFEPERYHDEYRERVVELIEKKAAGEAVVVQPTAEEPAKVVDLMSALEESLQAAKRRDQQQAI